MSLKLIGLGSPLLDLVLDGKQDLIDRFGLKSDGSVHASGQLLEIFNYVAEKYGNEVKYAPGGATLNAIKVAQWCNNEQGSTAVIGCLNDDEFGQIITSGMEVAGVQCFFQIKKEKPTGTCLVICNADNRSMVTYGGAAELFSSDFLAKPHIQTVIQEAHIYYCSGFTLIHSPEDVQHLATVAKQHKHKLFCLNLASVNICKKYGQQLKSLLPFIDVLFGNGEEADEFSRQCGFNTSRAEFALHLTQQEVVPMLPSQHIQKDDSAISKGRIIIFTQAEKPTIVAQDGCVQEFPPLPVAVSKIVDSNGAGDAFVGGFLASLMSKGSIEEAVSSGHYAANVVLKQRGCTLPARDSCNKDI